MEKIVTIVVLQFIGKIWGLLLKGAKMEKNRYNRRIAELLEINQVDHREWQMWKKRLQSWNCSSYVKYGVVYWKQQMIEKIVSIAVLWNHRKCMEIVIE